MDPSRISLRPFEISDAVDFLKWTSDERIAKNVRWDTITSKKEACEHLQKVAIPHPWNQSICLDNRSIGYLSVTRGSGDDKHRGYVAYAVAVEYWGQGIATIALKMALSKVFDRMPDLVRLDAYVLKENKASQRVLEKVGFLKEGLLRKWRMYKGGIPDALIYSFLNITTRDLVQNQSAYTANIKVTNLYIDPRRVSIRLFKLSDVDDFLKWASDDRVTANLRWDSITSREEALEHLEKVSIPHPWRRSICLDDHSIGYISIWQYSGDDRCRANIGYAVAAEYWGQGIATIALKMVLSCVFQDIPELVRLEALVEVENKGSQRVAEKVGFLKEGVLRNYMYSKGKIKDLIIYSFLSTDEVL